MYFPPTPPPPFFFWRTNQSLPWSCTSLQGSSSPPFTDTVTHWMAFTHRLPFLTHFIHLWTLSPGSTLGLNPPIAFLKCFALLYFSCLDFLFSSFRNPLASLLQNDLPLYYGFYSLSFWIFYFILLSEYFKSSNFKLPFLWLYIFW